MATYNQEYRWNPPRRKHQKYSLIERVVNFANKPLTSGGDSVSWKVGDVLQAINIRSGQTVLGVQVEIIELSDTANAKLKIGYGTDSDFWGLYDFSQKGVQTTGYKSEGTGMDHEAVIRNFARPLYFSSSDTIDITINKALTKGRVRLVVHLLEDDRKGGRI